MSKNLNKMNAAATYFTLTGNNNRPMAIPETSSITTFEGSLPHTFSTTDEDQTPAKVTTMAMVNEKDKGGKPPAHARYHQTQQTAAAILPPPFIYPIPITEENSLWNNIIIVHQPVPGNNLIPGGLSDLRPSGVAGYFAV